MKYKDGGKYRRKIGQARKSQSIYDNLGHPNEIDEKEVIFIGKKGEPYSLTKNKKYKIIKANILRDKGFFNYDEGLSKRESKTKSRRIECNQAEDYFITIINDKGNKRQYSHLMFKNVGDYK